MIIFKNKFFFIQKVEFNMKHKIIYNTKCQKQNPISAMLLLHIFTGYSRNYTLLVINDILI